MILVRGSCSCAATSTQVAQNASGRSWPRRYAAGSFDVGVLTLDGRGVHFEELRAQGIPVACGELRHRADPAGLCRILRLAGPASAVVSRGVSGHIVGHVLALWRGAGHVITEHLGPDPLSLRPYRVHQRLLLAPIRPRATTVVAVAGSQVDALTREGYKRHAVRVIPNGVADDPPVRDRQAVRAELGVPPKSFLAVLVAALRPEKQPTVFVDQITAAHVAEPSIHGLVVGDGPEELSVASAVAQSGGAVRMLGYRADAVDIMHAADVVCLTSAIEASPMSVLEAMSVGRPVIATDVGGVGELVADGDTGLLIPLDRPAEMAQALVTLARNRPRAEELGQAGRRRQQQLFSIDVMVDAYADLLAAVCRPARPRPVVAPRTAYRP